MQTIERRVAALESSASDDTLKIIIVEDGETQADALKRVGLPPDARGVVFGTPLDELL
ncbi:MAG: hypothetical protein KBF98_12735 [Rhodoferax sp.]|nr:hypothetical protein [Rhodoferax sp.]